MATGSNSDIELLAGLQGGGSISGASGKRIQHELENIINRINKNPAGVKITLSKNGEALLRQDIAKAVSSVKIESFNASAAIAKLKGDLKTALAEVSISPVGNTGSTSAGATKNKSSFKTQYPEFSVRANALSSEYTKMVRGDTAGSSADLANYTKRYSELLVKIEEARAAGRAVSNDTVSGLQSEIVLLENEIKLINEKAVAQRNAAMAVSAFKTQYPEFGVKTSALSSEFSKLVKSGATDNEVTQRTSEYKALLAEINRVRSAGSSANAEEVESIQNRTVQLTREIAALNDKVAVQREAASAAKEMAATENANVSISQVSALTKKVQSLLDNNPRAARTGYGDNLRRVLEKLQSGANLTAKEFDELKTSVSNVEFGMRQAGVQGKTLWSVLKSGYEKFGGWALITKSMMMAVNSVRKMIDNVTQLDAAMVELRKVTDETDATYEQFFVNATVRARNLGATVTDTINASADFARLGYNIEDAATLADTAIMYKNVGDGITDIGVASQSIISTLKGFSLEAEDATHVVDAFNEVGNNFAISSAGIGDALTRSAASLSAANNTMEESIALITAMNTTLQDPEKVGKCLCPAA